MYINTYTWANMNNLPTENPGHLDLKNIHSFMESLPVEVKTGHSTSWHIPKPFKFSNGLSDTLGFSQTKSIIFEIVYIIQIYFMINARCFAHTSMVQ